MPAALRPRTLAVTLISALLCSCASVTFDRTTETSGTFVSTGWAVTVLSHDLPKGALMIARENASDSRQPNMVVEETYVFPNLGRFDRLLDILCVRYARVSGTWGFSRE